MNEFLETLKARILDAQKRLQASQTKLAVANAEFQSVAQEVNALQILVQTEMHKEQANTRTPPASAQPALPADGATTETPAGPPAQASVTQSPVTNKSESNKTEAVRELLRQHPGGMTPGDIWKQIESQMTNRAYLYSVLKRLKDKGDAMERRGKYFPKPKPEEGRGQAVVQ